MNREAAAAIRAGDVFLGIKLGSTRIKAVLTDAASKTLAQRAYAGRSPFWIAIGRRFPLSRPRAMF